VSNRKPTEPSLGEKATIMSMFAAPKPKLAHTGNMHSQILSGLGVIRGLKAHPFAAVHGGSAMSPENLAVLKSLAIRPSKDIAPSLQPVVAGLQQAGFITSSPSGWSATAKGCEVLQQQPPRRNHVQE
jgi:hypothetical protein